MNLDKVWNKMLIWSCYL